MQDNQHIDDYKERLTNFSHEFDPGLFLHIVKRSLVWVILLIVVAFAGAFLYLRYTPEIYEARAVIQLSEEDSGERIVNVSRVSQDHAIEARVELLRSKLLIQRTLARMPMEVSYFAKGRILTNEHYVISPYRVELIELKNESLRNKPIFIEFEEQLFSLAVGGKRYENLPLAKEVSTDDFRMMLTVHNEAGLLSLVKENELFFRINTPEALAGRFLRGLDIRILNSTAKTLEISFKDNNPFLARDFVSALSDEFISFDLEKRQRSDENILAFIDAQIDTVYERLRSSETLLSSYKQDNRITDLSNVSSVFLGRLTDLENRVIHLEVEEQLLNDVERITDMASDEVALDNLVPLVAGSTYEAAMASQLTNLERLLFEREKSLFTVTPDNMQVRRLEHQIALQKSVLIETIRALRDKIIVRKNDAIAKLREVESYYYGLPSKELEYARLERIFAINEKYYTMLLEKRIAYRISKEGFVSNNQILEDVRLPSAPVSPNGKMIVFSFVMAGLMLGFIFISVRYLVHNEITSLNEIVRLSNASISTLGVIPKYREFIPTSMLLVNKSPKSLIAEAFRTVRTNMQFIDNSEGPKVVGVTSAISGEGKTFVVLNLAGIIAFSGKKVVVLDLDMRRPRIHKGMECDNDHGMSTLLIGKTTIEATVRHSDQENLDFITAGPIPPNPSELILSPAFDAIVEKLKKLYDVIVIDTPPVGLVTDGISIIAKADYPIYVFRADYSKKRFVQNVDRLTNENRIARLSVILNGVDLERNKYAYSYGYGYGYGYSYDSNGYYEEGKKKKGFWSRLFKR